MQNRLLANIYTKRPLNLDFVYRLLKIHTFKRRQIQGNMLSVYARRILQSVRYVNSTLVSTTRVFCSDKKDPVCTVFNMDPTMFQSVEYKIVDRVAHITLNRPHRFNAIDMHMPIELEQAVELANLDSKAKVAIRSYKRGLFLMDYF